MASIISAFRFWITRKLVDYDYQRAKISMMLTTSEQDRQIEIYKEIQAKADELFGSVASVEFGGEVMFWLAQIRYIVMGRIQNIILAIIVVALFCILVFRSLSTGHSTILNFKKFKIDAGLDTEIFTQRYLESSKY